MFTITDTIHTPEKLEEFLALIEPTLPPGVGFYRSPQDERGSTPLIVQEVGRSLEEHCLDNDYVFDDIGWDPDLDWLPCIVRVYLEVNAEGHGICLTFVLDQWLTAQEVWSKVQRGSTDLTCIGRNGRHLPVE
jgi:hypothetical protein